MCMAWECMNFTSRRFVHVLGDRKFDSVFQVYFRFDCYSVRLIRLIKDILLILLQFDKNYETTISVIAEKLCLI